MVKVDALLEIVYLKQGKMALQPYKLIICFFKGRLTLVFLDIKVDLCVLKQYVKVAIIDKMKG